MATRIFDRETLLDLVVNAVPLLIMAFFVVVFVLFAPFGFDPLSSLASLLQFGLVLGPFVALLILTYFSAKVIAGAEKSGPVFLPGQTTPSEAEPIEETHGPDEGGDRADAPAASEKPGVPSDDGDAGADATDRGDDGTQSA
ncbi:MAG: DUF6684 family protein [Haloferacaceae archaeon]